MSTLPRVQEDIAGITAWLGTGEG